MAASEGSHVQSPTNSPSSFSEFTHLRWAAKRDNVPMGTGYPMNLVHSIGVGANQAILFPLPLPAPVPGLSQSIPPIATLPPVGMVSIPGGATSGTIAGPLRPCKQQFSTSPPCPVERARKAITKSKCLADTETDAVRIGNNKTKAKGKGKAKARTLSPDGDNPDVDKLPVVVIRALPPPPPPSKKDEMPDWDDSEVEEDTKVKPGKGKEPSKSGECQAGTKKGDTKGKGKCRRPQPIGSSLQPCMRCTSMNLECEPWVTKRGELARTCTLCNKWRMRCIQAVEPAMHTSDKTAMPTHPVAPILTCSKMTIKIRNAKKSTRKGSLSVSLVPISEALDVDVEMLDPDAVAGPGDPSPTSHDAPLASADDFPADHWIKPVDDHLLSPASFEDTPGEVRYSPVYLACTYRPYSPVTASLPLQSDQHPRPSMDVDIEAMLAQIQLNMVELCTHDETIHTKLSDCINRLHADYTGQLGIQKGLVDTLATQVSGIAHYLRDNQWTAAAMVSTPPSFNPPPIVIPGTPIFPEFSSISALGRAVTNNVFTPVRHKFSWFCFIPCPLTGHSFPLHMVNIPQDWALYQTYLAGELVYDIFISKISQQPVQQMSTGLLDIDTCIALEHLANVLAIAYTNPGRIIVWYLPGGMTGMMMTDMYCATHSMRDLLIDSITTRKVTEWRTHESNFYPSLDGKVTPGCINISPAWLQQGIEKHGFPNLDPEDGFSPGVSATLKGDSGHNIMTSLQRSSILVSAALQVMHPDLFQAGIEIHVRLGIYHLVVMDFMNLGIKFLYDSGSMLAASCCLVRHHMNVEEGSHIVTAWYMRDSIHNFVGTPRTDYAKYGNIVRYNAHIRENSLLQFGFHFRSCLDDISWMYQLLHLTSIHLPESDHPKYPPMYPSLPQLEGVMFLTMWCIPEGDVFDQMVHSTG
ncbi:uncharacterized protein EDB93DRAFT_1108643 [Suillus bovinus]|uniref:uncharacterized protein n=1 Tax=Suillus bovinus TaxID=48563 RepID=UPI001B8753DD|nr:uncharacterized protein EDB93DRAFT_1108643 [Suillus bovinus]KAG2129656.1 hypothetical protein EDB93DRAFT_1108643 [Suillus bovinus]